MRLMQRGGVEDDLHPFHTTSEDRPIQDRAHDSRERRLEYVNSGYLVSQRLQRTNQALAQMSGASCNECFHRPLQLRRFPVIFQALNLVRPSHETIKYRS